AGREYRLTQRCRHGMPDRWFDGKATEPEVTASTATACARLIGGVCRNGAGYPSREDGEYRRAGMVNFRIARTGLDNNVAKQLDTSAPRLELHRVTRKELADTVGRAAVAEEPAGREAVNRYMEVVATILAVLVDEIAATAPAAEAVVVIAPRDELRSLGRLEPACGEAELGGGGSVRDPAFAERLLRVSRRPAGAPLDVAVVVDYLSGEVLASGDSSRRGSSAPPAQVTAQLDALRAELLASVQKNDIREIRAALELQRTVDPTVLITTCTLQTAKAQAEAALDQWLAACNTDDSDYQLEGDPTGARFKM
ncbi:unnamed protein product, partial [Prorocentrum cordatum]